MRIKPNKEQLAEIRCLAGGTHGVGRKLKERLYAYKIKKCKRIHKDLLDEAGIFLSDEQEQAILVKTQYKEIKDRKTVSVR